MFLEPPPKKRRTADQRSWATDCSNTLKQAKWMLEDLKEERDDYVPYDDETTAETHHLRAEALRVPDMAKNLLGCLEVGGYTAVMLECERKLE